MDNNPYAPPKASLTDPPRVVEGYEFRDIGTITKALSVLLSLGIVVQFLNLGSSYMQLALLGRGSFTPTEAATNDARELVASLGFTLVSVITVIVFGRWIYLAHRNLPALGAENLRARPGWAVGSFFVPIANLWHPFQAMSDLVRASRDPHQWHLDDTPLLVVIWWILWLVVNVLGTIVSRVTLASNTVDSLEEATVLQIVLGVLNVPLYVLALLIVRRVWRDQARVVSLT